MSFGVVYFIQTDKEFYKLFHKFLNRIIFILFHINTNDFNETDFNSTLLSGLSEHN